MISQELEVTLHMAFVEARQQRLEFITVEHLLLALIDNPSAADILKACAVNNDELKKYEAFHKNILGCKTFFQFELISHNLVCWLSLS